MATEPTNLPQFHRAGQMQSAADVEWQRALLERLRIVCREEMMDAMKTLVDSGHVTPALDEKLSAMEESAKSLQEDVRQSASLSRGALWKAVLLTAMVSFVLFLGGVALLHFAGGAALVNEGALKTQQAQAQKKALLTAEVQNLGEQKVQLESDVQKITEQHQALNAEVARSTEAQRALAANLGTLEQQFKKLQQLQEQFRFKLVKGEAGGAFVEIPEDAEPFNYNGKIYIQVR